MKIRWLLTSIVIALCTIISTVGDCAVERDYCKHLLPYRLKKQLARAYPDYRTMSSAFTDKSNIEDAKATGRSCCYYIAAGDFNKDGQVDYAIILKNIHDWRLIVLVALNNGDKWAITVLDSDDENNQSPYIEVLPPDKYGGLGLIDPDYQEEGQPDYIDSSAEGVLYGTLDSSGCAYFLVGDKWVHMWLSD